VSETEKKILVVEDESITFMMLEFHLKRAGYAVCENAPDLKTAVALFHTRRPDLVLMDINLANDSNGIDAAKLILEEDQDAVIIFMTGYDHPEIKERARQLHPADYMVKPVQMPVLLEKIREILAG
jgi:DNA-binding response OmpR family regulator